MPKRSQRCGRYSAVHVVTGRRNSRRKPAAAIEQHIVP
jgi:hypothetical protein